MADKQGSTPAPPPTPNVIPVEILKDLVCRFTANIPVEEQNNLTRICFQIELAHWLFIDHYCKPGDKLHHLAHVPFNVFASLIFQMTPYLRSYSQQNLDQILNEFREYKWKVPTYGAILMDKALSQVLLVQGFGNTWGFPKGKVNKDEEAVICAIREVKEETGYDITNLVNPNHFIESNANDRNARLYLVVGVDTSFPFKPLTSYEIRQIGWFDVNELPENKKDPTNVSTRGYNNNQFYTTFTFIKRLKRWIYDKKSGQNQINCFRCPTMSSMRFPYSNDQRTIWEMDSPMTFSGTPITAAATAPRPVVRNVLQKTNSKPSDDAKWTQELKRVQNLQKKKPAGLAQTAPAPHKKSIESTDSINDKFQHVKRRLLFTEEPEISITATTESNKGFVVKSMISITKNPEPDFFEGPGASAWLNFTLSLKDFQF